MDKENGENTGNDKNKANIGHAGSGAATSQDPSSLLDAASLFGK